MEELLKFQSVDICYNGTKIVDDVTFSLHKGEILGIVGESGSGKSTLLKSAMGLLGPKGLVTRGDIWFHDKNIPDLSKKELRKICGEEIGMIFQDCGTSLCPIRTIGEQIYECMSEHKSITKSEAKEQALELFAKLGLKDGIRIWNSYPFELSGGMNQRSGIAISMLMKPQILLADEPTSALDVAVQKQVIEEMKYLRDTFDISIIIVTHDIGVVSAMADTVLVLQHGKIMEYGEAKQVLEAPKNEYTKKLMSAVPKLVRRN
ncbi:Oligopeptide transport ATP-binding protein OppD [Lachnospiraceae bacterium TWA4]|nr:Oligopeptide transport ATP-binding protein OppD [Lachnospiraceae bacterium TWA4]